jgi:hypothetical protein
MPGFSRHPAIRKHEASGTVHPGDKHWDDRGIRGGQLRENSS